MITFEEKKKLIEQIREKSGTISDLKSMIKRLKDEDPFFESNDQMIDLETNLNAWILSLDLEHNMEINKETVKDIVNRLLNIDGSTEDIEAYLFILKRNFDHPNISDLFFYNDHQTSVEDIVNEIWPTKTNGEQ